MLTRDELLTVLDAAGIVETVWWSGDIDLYLSTAAAEIARLPDDPFASLVFEIRLGDLRWIGDQYGLPGLQLALLAQACYRYRADGGR